MLTANFGTINQNISN